jgi:hypothetical protein
MFSEASRLRAGQIGLAFPDTAGEVIKALKAVYKDLY